MQPSDARFSVAAIVADKHDALRALNDKIHVNPELGYKEFIAHDTLSAFLESHGFSVTRSAYGLETCLEARWPAGPTVAGSPSATFCAEYDALPEIGHACGHNLIATASVAASIALAQTLERAKIPGTVRLLGTPAEEGGGGKVKLIDAGAFLPFDRTRPEVALMAHPVSFKSFTMQEKLPPSTKFLAGFRCIASEELQIEFFGRSAHAGGEPWLGRNALDAAVTAYTAMSQLRQHIRADERVNVIINHGGDAPNVIPAYASLLCILRAPTKVALEDISSRVRACAAGAAQVAGCEVKVKLTEPAYLDLRVVDAISTVCAEEIVEVEGGNTAAVVAHSDFQRTISTDMGNVSYVLPSLHAIYGIPSQEGASCHDPRFTEASGSDEAFETALRVGRGLAMLGWRFITEPELTHKVAEQYLSS
ncbi:putative metal-dependent amidase aminoacylase carboxypeptidase protein [Phaeoacremonium minimum UCRPA7]|uniref:Peptidase M20 domain-containing protein 2 n=1 Tax=Phaeoacremonium minimum (strain UCR-PA7) TaxID=1286976 RepID=R8BFK5_PHAM7|nr:putative metal-dependent amidase aminoacylase carboxypeptidase protein [Phaeoacremonium minimum UCRPA7]EON98091.1 putative metal-dependent amidase aminoacylase carboxypeptidase protein [Phaeoacremonium minimum UCRPA7]